MMREVPQRLPYFSPWAFIPPAYMTSLLATAHSFFLPPVSLTLSMEIKHFLSDIFEKIVWITKFTFSFLFSFFIQAARKVDKVIGKWNRHDQIDYLTGPPERATDSFSDDLLFYMNNNHSVLSIFLAHRSHPFSRKERLICLISSLSLAFFLTALSPYVQNLHTTIPFFFWIYSNVIGPALCTLWDNLLMKAATCPCLQNHDWTDKTNWMVEKLGQAMLGLALLFSVPLVVAGVLAIHFAKELRYLKHFYRQWIWMTVKGWIISIPIMIITFTVMTTVVNKCRPKKVRHLEQDPAAQNEAEVLLIATQDLDTSV